LRLKNNLEEALRIYLDEKNIQYLAVYGRVKSFESFYEKIDTKNYGEPFVQTEDFVGLRIILYFPNDILVVEKLLNDTFIVEQSEDKSDKLEINEFGYRSHHCIIKIDPDWAKTPNYRELHNIKSEIQIRTVLMHAWAEIEHKLQYKNKKQVPSQLKRKLFFLSAKLEEADQQFEEIKISSNQYQVELAKKIEDDGAFDTELEFNLDTYKQFLFFFYPDFLENKDMEQMDFNLILNYNLTYIDLVDIANKFKKVESELIKKVTNLSRSAVFFYAIEVIRPDVIEEDVSSGSRLDIIDELTSFCECV